jgi:hypothetical protein
MSGNTDKAAGMANEAAGIGRECRSCRQLLVVKLS